MIIENIFRLCVVVAGGYLLFAGCVNWLRSWREDFEISLRIYCAMEIFIGLLAVLSIFI